MNRLVAAFRPKRLVRLTLTKATFLLAAFPAQAQPAPPVPAVLVQPAELKSLARQADFIGRVEAIEKVDLRARVSGFLGPIKFNAGDSVKAGQSLFDIEPESFQAAVDQRQAQVESAEAAALNADQQFERARELGRTNSASQSQIDQRQADQGRAAAAVKEAKAALQDAKIKLSYTKISSPIDGRVGRPATTAGNLVGPDSGVLATVVKDDEINVLFAVSQRQLLESRQRNVAAEAVRVRLKLADGSLYPTTGKIDFVDVSTDAKTDSQLLRARFPNPSRLLSDGQTVRVMLEVDNEAQSVVAPAAAVAVDQSGPYVLVVNDSNQVELRRIRTGAQTGPLVAVEAGLKERERVIVQGQQRVRPGQTVNPQPLTR